MQLNYLFDYNARATILVSLVNDFTNNIIN